VANNSKLKFTIATIGVEERERQWLKQIVEISQHRAVRFSPYVLNPDTVPNIVVVDADAPQALVNWEGYHTKKATKNQPISGIVLARERPASNPKYFIQRPVVATRLLAMLERVALDEHGIAGAAAIEVAEQQPAAAEAKPAAYTPQAHAKGGVTALVVDDSLPVRVQMKSSLKPLASHVDFAETGEEAMEFINKKRYDIVFLDVILPGIDGYEVCRAIKHDPANRSTPVIMLTGNSSPADRVKGKLAGCDTYLIKPVRQTLFEQVVKEFLKTPLAA
jgi:twitching motility two-component system response regulator PilG